MRNIRNRQKLLHRRDPIARLLPRFKPAVTRNRTKYSRKGRQQAGYGWRSQCHAHRERQDAKGSKRPLPDTPVLTPLSTGTVGAPGARLRASLRMAKRAPCAFTETAVKRAIRAVRAAGETPGRLVVTREGFTVEFAVTGAVSAAGDSGSARADGDSIATPRAAANLWDELLASGVQQQ